MSRPAGPEPAPPGRLIGSKLVEYVVAVRIAHQALRFVLGDPELSERFRQELLGQAGRLQPGSGDEAGELMTPGLLGATPDLFAEAMILEGYQ